MFFGIIFFSLMVSQGIADKSKKENLTMLAFWPLTGDPLFDGSTCRAAMKIALDNVNSRMDILPLYHVDIAMLDEGSNGLLSVSNFIPVIQRHQEDETRACSTPFAPIVIAPYFSTGCKHLAELLKFYNMVGISSSCPTPEITARRDRYPNLYRIRTPEETTAYSRIKFLSQYGKWTKIAMVVNGQSSGDFEMADYFYREAIRHGFKITGFEADFGLATSEVYESFLRDDVRVLVIESTSPTFVLDSLCKAYDLGMTGSKYVFIAPTNAWIDPLDMPFQITDDCTKDKAVKQLKFTVWIGMITEAKRNYGKTSLGYDRDEFETIFDNQTNTLRSAEHNFRHLCHDAVLHALLILDGADRYLQGFNLSLSADPETVMEAVNKSAANSKFVNLHSGRAKYSARLEMDNESQLVGRYSGATDTWVPAFEIELQEGSSLWNISSYHFKETGVNLSWLTKNGNPPRDASLVIVRLDEEFDTALIACTVLACILASCQIVMVAKMLGRSSNPETSPMPRVTFTTLIACFFITLSAIACVLQLFNNHAILLSSLPCILQMAFLTTGLSLLTMSLMLRLEVALHGPEFLSSWYSFIVYAILERHQDGHSIVTPERVREADRFIAKGAVVFVVQNLVVLGTWLGVTSTHGGILRIVYHHTFYELSEDTFYKENISICFYDFTHGAFITVAVLQGAVLALSVRKSAACSTQSNLIAIKDQVKRSAVALLNMVTFICASILIIIMIPGPDGKTIAGAFLALFLSAVSTAILFLPSVRQKQAMASSMTMPTLTRPMATPQRLAVSPRGSNLSPAMAQVH